MAKQATSTLNQSLLNCITAKTHKQMMTALNRAANILLQKPNVTQKHERSFLFEYRELITERVDQITHQSKAKKNTGTYSDFAKNARILCAKVLAMGGNFETILKLAESHTDLLLDINAGLYLAEANLGDAVVQLGRLNPKFLEQKDGQSCTPALHLAKHGNGEALVELAKVHPDVLKQKTRLNASLGSFLVNADNINGQTIVKLAKMNPCTIDPYGTIFTLLERGHVDCVLELIDNKITNLSDCLLKHLLKEKYIDAFVKLMQAFPAYLNNPSYETEMGDYRFMFSSMPLSSGSCAVLPLARWLAEEKQISALVKLARICPAMLTVSNKYSKQKRHSIASILVHLKRDKALLELTGLNPELLLQQTGVDFVEQLATQGKGDLLVELAQLQPKIKENKRAIETARNFDNADLEERLVAAGFAQP